MDGAWLRERRKELRLSQTELGRKLGVSQNQISSWETNKSAPAAHHVAALRRILAMSGGGAVPRQAASGSPRHIDQGRGPSPSVGGDLLPTETSPAGPARDSRVGDEEARLAPQIGYFGRFVDEVGAITVGKVIKRDAKGVTLEVFRSLVAPEFETLTLPFDKVEVFDPPRQTLVYRARGPHWVMGRTIRQEARDHFTVKFPNHSEPVVIPRGEVFIRSPRPSDDPTALLAGQATSSPHFTEARHRFVEFVNSQRSRYRGLTALASARIEFHAHQIAAVRRVLSDPVHRYLLADEVGLGKTIEAGLLISQHLIDEGVNASVLVLVPDSLHNQWAEELAKSFGLRNDPRVRILSFSALDSNDSALCSPAPTLLVMDEAHRAAAWAFPRESGLDGSALDGSHIAGSDSRYQVLDELARCPKVLLLSGTPVLNHEDGFLAMLHLLEPEAYDLADRDGFRKRIAARRVVANALSELTPDFQPGFLSEALTQLTKEVVGDGELDNRVGAVAGALASDPPTAGAAVEDLRSYLLERYRLHRRIVRTHRESQSIAHLLPKRCGMGVLVTGEDPARARASEALDAWRRRVLDENSRDPASIAFVFGDLLAQAFSHPRQLGRAFERRALALRHDATLEFFPDEGLWLQHVASEFAHGTGFVRIATLIGEFLGPLAKRRAVVFVDAPDEAAAVVEQLQGSTELAQRVVRFVPGEVAALALYEHRSNAILVCDRNAEEGLNLQKKPATIIFLDLPFDIGRIEQRIGRFDRLEGMKELRFLTPAPVGLYEIGWARLLVEQVKIFDRSVARLQYVLAEAMQTLRKELLEAGPEEAFEAISARFADPKTGLEPLAKQLRRQETLDATEWRDDELQDFGAAIAEARDLAVDDAQDALEGWLKELRFEVKDVPERGAWYTHVRRERGASTILAISSMDAAIERWLDQEASQWSLEATLRAYGPFVFDPDDDSEKASLLSVGHPFFDAVFACMKTDDRSKSWGLWRYYPDVISPQTYVCFDFSIEASLAKLTPVARTWRTLASLRRRADEMFSVEHRRIWLDLDGVPVIDPAITSVLERPYSREIPGAAGDQNLNRERWALANQHLPVADWTARITTLRVEFEAAVRAEVDLQRRCKASEAKVLFLEEQTVRILRSRAAHASAREKRALDAAIRLEQELGAALRKGVRTPDLCVDNAGVVVLAPRPLV